MRLKQIAFGLMLLLCFNVFGQQKETTTLAAQPQKAEMQILEETISQLQIENQTMQKQLEKMEKEIEYYRGDVRTKVEELDNAQNRWLTMLTIIMGLIGIFFGIGVPIFINRDNSKRFESRFSEIKEDLKNKVTVAEDQAKNATEQVVSATEQAKKAEEASYQMKNQVKSVTEQVNLASEQAKIATEQAKKAEEASYQMKNQVKSVTEQVNLASEQAKQAKQAVYEIADLKKHLAAIEEKIKQDAAVAEKAAKEAQASQLFTQALSEKEDSKAIELYTQAIELNPDFSEAYNNRGILKSILGDTEGSMKDHNKSIELSPNDATAYYNRGILKSDLEDEEGAIKDYDKAIIIAPNYADAYNNRAMALLGLGKLNEALNDVNIAIAIEKDKKRNDYYDTKGQIYMAMDNYEKALEEFDRALSIDDKYIDSLENRAKCYRKKAEKEDDTAKKAALIAKAETDEKKAESLK